MRATGPISLILRPSNVCSKLRITELLMHFSSDQLFCKWPTYITQLTYFCKARWAVRSLFHLQLITPVEQITALRLCPVDTKRPHYVRHYTALVHATPLPTSVEGLTG